MKIGVVGAGAWGANIVRTLHGLDRLAAVVELSPQIRANLAQTHPDLTVHETLAPLLESDVPAVAIATPGHTHLDVALQALAAGKDVFVEKPLALSVADGQAMVDAAEKHGRVLMVGHLLMYQPAIEFVRQALQDGLIGEVRSFHQERLNLGRARAVENVLWSIGVHDVAVLLHLAKAAPETVTMAGQAALQPNIEDDVYVHMTFAGGVQAHLHTSWLWPDKRRRLTVVGSTGMLVYDEMAQTVTLHRKSIDAKLANVDQGEEIVFHGAGEPLKIEMEHFLHCVETRSTPKSDGRSAVEVLRVLELAGGKA